MRLVSRIFIALLCFSSWHIVAPNQVSSIDEQSKDASSAAELISFNYSQEELVNVINYMATKMGLNILLPTKTEERVTGKLTWKLDEKVRVDKAWNILQTILSIAGYNVVPYPTYTQIVKATAVDMKKEAVPLYVGVPYEELPATDQYIRYMYYLANIKADDQGGENPVTQVLKSWLPSSAFFTIEAASNTLIVMAQANDIRAIMPVIASLDRPGFQEKMEIISLKHTQARTIATLFNDKILESTDANRYRLDAKKVSESTFFSKNLKIVANERRNNLIVLGRPQTIDRTRNFIKNYLDVAQDSGKSILHTYRLQYLNAVDFAQVLESVLLQKDAGGLGQSTGGRQQATGPQRYFDEVIIAVDTPDTAGVATGGITAEGEETRTEAAYYGGNTLIIACRSDDWKRIEALIGKLDQPSPQVLIEVLITDLTLDDTKALGSALRNPEKIPLAGSTAFQSAHLSPGIMAETFEQNVPDNTIGLIEDKAGNVTSAADLLRNFGVANGQRVDVGTDSIPANLEPGSTILSFNDNTSGKTWGITQILKTIDHSRILSHPHVISTSGKKAEISSSETRLVQADASGSAGSQVVSTRKDIDAALKVEITPRIALSEEQENSVNLQVYIDINQFISTTNNTRITRNVTTNVTMNTGDILALGGLIRSREQDVATETPVLSKVPIIGWFFKKRKKEKERTNLTVFISPTVILPRQRDDMQQYTQDYLNLSRSMAKEGGMFDSLKDPITRWFFTSESPTEEFTKDFLKNDIRFQETPMPQASLSPTKPFPQKENYQHQFVQQSNDQHDQLKDLFKEVDNPFEQLKPESLAQNEKTTELAPAQQAPRRRRRRK